LSLKEDEIILTKFKKDIHVILTRFKKDIQVILGIFSEFLIPKISEFLSDLFRINRRNFSYSKSVLSSSSFGNLNKMINPLNIVNLLMERFKNEGSSGAITAEEHHLADVIANFIQKDNSTSEAIEKTTLRYDGYETDSDVESDSSSDED